MGKRKGTGKAGEQERMRIAYRHPLDQAGWTVAYHFITLDQRISDGALRLYLLLHRYAQQRGETWTSVERLAQDLGVTDKTIQRRLKALTRVGLIERRREGFGATFLTYILDPRGRYSEILQESSPIPDKNVQYGETIPDKNVRSYWTKMSAHEEITTEEIEEQEEERRNEIAEIAETLKENGVFAAAAEEIAREMADAGLTPEDALDILLGTIQSIQTGMPRGEEEVMSLAVDRLQRGIWDRGERVRATLRQARYRGGGSDQPLPLGGGEISGMPGGRAESEPEVSGEEHIWMQALEALRLEMTRATFTTWLAPSRCVGRKGDVLVVEVANRYARDWLEGRLREQIEQAVFRVAGERLSVRFVVEEG